MTPSKHCEDFIKSFEKCRLKGFLPTPDDVPTCGWGATGQDITLETLWTQEQADARFRDDLAHFAAGVETAIGGKATTQAQFDAMVSLAYNIGLGGRIPGFRTSSVLRLHRAGDYANAARAFLLWNKQKGKALDGLTRRRLAEAAMYRGA